jgi:hypothetical protein
MFALSSIVMMLKLGDVLTSSGPKLMLLKLRVLKLVNCLVREVIGGGLLEVGTPYFR